MPRRVNLFLAGVGNLQKRIFLGKVDHCLRSALVVAWANIPIPIPVATRVVSSFSRTASVTMCGELVKQALPDGGAVMLFIGRLEQGKLPIKDL